MTDTANPLVAARVDSTQWYSGVGLAESIADIVVGVESGSWIDTTIGGVSGSLEALGLVVDPLGSLVSWGVAWLLEHVKPLSDALDWLAGDPDQISAYALTWRNVANNSVEAAAELRAAVLQQVADWTGAAADAYRTHAGGQIIALDAIGRAAGGISSLVEGAGLLVALVRELVRDLIADFVSVLAVRLPMWLAEEGLTLGLATPLVVSQVGALVAKWAAKISKLVLALINSLRKLRPLLSRLGELVDELQALLRRSSQPDPTQPNTTNGRDADGDGTADGLDPDSDGNGRYDDFNGDGHPDVPPPIIDGPTVPTTEMKARYQGEENQGVEYLDAQAREDLRVFVGPEGVLYRTDGTVLDTSDASTFWSGDGRAIFVMDGHGNLYVSPYQEPGRFHHSSILAGGPVAGAGEVKVIDGRLELISDQSGHYLPGRSYTQRVLELLQQQGADVGGISPEFRAPEGT